ncbi:MAG: cytochrome c [Pseudomonadota bacterium]
MAHRIGLMVAGLALMTGMAIAHEGAMGVVKERMDAMKGVGSSMRPLVAIMRGQSAFDADTVRDAGLAIARHGRVAAEKFPPGSGGGVSEARDAIWAEDSTFDAKMNAFIARAETLSVSADEGEVAFRAAFQSLAQTCGDCHETYRIKK